MRLLKVLQEPQTDKHKQEDVLSSRVVSRDGDSQKVFLRLRRTKFVTVVYDTEYDVDYRRLAPDRALSNSISTKVVEIENAGTPRERALPEGNDHGYMWRLNSYWRYKQIDDGVLVEIESLTLSRNLPAIIGPLIRPIVTSTARESMTRTLASVRARFATSRTPEPGLYWDREGRPGGPRAEASSKTFVQSLGHKKFHAKQIYHWIWKRGVTDFDEMTNLSRELRAALAEAATVSLPEVVQHDVSEDGTQKFVLRLADGRQIESVFIPDTPKQTFCVSTQVGCAMGCAFCLTGKMGLIRHLSAAEIAGQVRLLARIAATCSTSPSTSC